MTRRISTTIEATCLADLDQTWKIAGRLVAGRWEYPAGLEPALFKGPLPASEFSTALGRDERGVLTLYARVRPRGLTGR